MPEQETSCPYGADSDIDARYLAGTLSPEESARELVAHVCDRAAPLQAGWHAWLRDLHGIAYGP